MGAERRYALIGHSHWPQTQAEIDAGVAPTDYQYEPGDVRRYGASSGGSAATNATAFQAAVDSTHKVLVPNGSYSINAAITLASNTHIQCERNVTITQTATGTPVLDADDVSDIVIDGGRYVGANTTTAIDGGDGGVIYIDNRGAANGNVRIVNTEVSTSANAGISCISVVGLWVQNNEISNIADFGVLASRCTDFHIDHNYIRDSAESGATNTYGVSATGADASSDDQPRSSISFNHILNFASWDGIMTHECRKLIIHGNVIENVRTGIDATATASNNVIEDLVITSNVIRCTTTDNYSGAGALMGGIVVHGTATLGAARVAVANNIIKDFGQITGGLLSGDGAPIAFEEVEYIACTGNVIENVGSIGCTPPGIWLIGDCIVASITGNTLDGNMDGGGIRLTNATATALSISGNTIIQDTASDGAIVITGSTVTNMALGANATNSTTPYSVSTSTIGYSASAINESYTATLTGCTTSPTGTVEASVNDDIVTLEIPTISGTSNTTAATLTGMPASLRPSGNMSVIGITTDNGNDTVSRLNIASDGTITLYVGTSPTFTSSGTKGVALCTVTYRLR